MSQCAHGESAVNAAWRYDARLHVWHPVAAMRDKRAYFYACSLSLSDCETDNGKQDILLFSYIGPGILNFSISTKIYYIIIFYVYATSKAQISNDEALFCR